MVRQGSQLGNNLDVHLLSNYPKNATFLYFVLDMASKISTNGKMKGLGTAPTTDSDEEVEPERLPLFTFTLLPEMANLPPNWVI